MHEKSMMQASVMEKCHWCIIMNSVCDLSLFYAHVTPCKGVKGHADSLAQTFLILPYFCMIKISQTAEPLHIAH